MQQPGKRENNNKMILFKCRRIKDNNAQQQQHSFLSQASWGRLINIKG
jgi:hypothetical protein